MLKEEQIDDKHQVNADGNDNAPSASAPSLPQQFCLRWNNYQTNLTNVFDQLLQSESFVDVTLACEGHRLKAHKMILSACSPYFQSLFFENPCQHPIIIMHGFKWPELKAAVEFMYKGEISISQDQIGPLLKVAEFLKIRGLTDINSDRDPVSAADLALLSPLQNKPASSLTSLRRDEGMVVSKVRKRQHSMSDRDCSSQDSSPHRSTSTQISSALQSFSPSMVPSLPLLPVTPPLSMLNDDMEIKSRFPTWSQAQLQFAIGSVVSQKMRFTEAATKYNIPKGTLYDNILGKTKRMHVLEEAGLTRQEEEETLEFCCNVKSIPHNRRTKIPLSSVLAFVERIRQKRDKSFKFTGLSGFRWWWAFCKKHSIVSLYYNSSTSPVRPYMPGTTLPINDELFRIENVEKIAQKRGYTKVE